jgi:hypothetical protein
MTILRTFALLALSVCCCAVSIPEQRIFTQTRNLNADAVPRRIYKLDSFLQEQLTSSVACKDHDHLAASRKLEFFQPGQISGMNFQLNVKMFSETEGFSEKDMALNVIDFIGKVEDVDLLKILMSQLGSTRMHSLNMVVQTRLKCDTAENLVAAIEIARSGTMAHLKFLQKCMRSWCRNHQTQNSPPILSHPTTWDLIMTQSTPKSLSREQFMQTLARVGCDDYSGRVYVNWLAVMVLPTVKPTDLVDTLTKWHQLPEWEKYLTSIVRVTDLHVQFDVSDGFDILPLVVGFISCNWDFLATCPGVDADRRIARCVIFAEWALKTLMHSTGKLSETGGTGRAAAFATCSTPSLESHLPRAAGRFICDRAEGVTTNHPDGAAGEQWESPADEHHIPPATSSAPASASHCPGSDGAEDVAAGRGRGGGRGRRRRRGRGGGSRAGRSG